MVDFINEIGHIYQVIVIDVYENKMYQQRETFPISPIWRKKIYIWNRLLKLNFKYMYVLSNLSNWIHVYMYMYPIRRFY